MALHRAPKVAIDSSILHPDHHFTAGKKIALSHALFRESDFENAADSGELRELQANYNDKVRRLRDAENDIALRERKVQKLQKRQTAFHKKNNTAGEAESSRYLNAGVKELARLKRDLVGVRKEYLEAQEQYQDKRASAVVKPRGLQGVASAVNGLVFRPTRAGTGEFQPADIEAHVFSANEVFHPLDPNGIAIQPNAHGIVLPEISSQHIGQSISNDLAIAGVDIVGLASTLASLKTITTACALEKGVKTAITQLQGVIHDLGLKKSVLKNGRADGEATTGFFEDIDPAKLEQFHTDCAALHEVLKQQLSRIRYLKLVPGALSGAKSTILTAAVVVAKLSPVGLGIASGISTAKFAQEMSAYGKYAHLQRNLENTHPELSLAHKGRKDRNPNEEVIAARHAIDRDEDLQRAAAQHAEYVNSRKYHGKAAVSNGLIAAGTAALVAPSAAAWGAALHGAALPLAAAGFAAITPGLVIASKLNIYLEFGLRREVAESLAQHADDLHLHITNYNDLQHEIAKYRSALSPALEPLLEQEKFQKVLTNKLDLADALKQKIDDHIESFMTSLDQKDASKTRVYRANERVKLARAYKTDVNKNMNLGRWIWVRGNELKRSEAVDGLRFGTFNLFEGGCKRLSVRTDQRNADKYLTLIPDADRRNAMVQLNADLAMPGVENRVAHVPLDPNVDDGHLVNLLPTLESNRLVASQVARLLAKKMVRGGKFRSEFLPLVTRLTDDEHKALVEELTAAGLAQHCDVGDCPKTLAWMRKIAEQGTEEDKTQLGDQVASRFDQYMLYNLRREAKGDRRYFARYVRAYEIVEGRGATAQAAEQARAAAAV